MLFASTDFISEVINVVLSIMGFGMVALVFYLGGLAATYIKVAVEYIAEGFNLWLDKTVVDIILKLLVAAAALIIAAPSIPPFEAVVDTMIPIGDFNDISGAFADREGRFLINIIFNVMLEQIALSFAYFIPFILVNMVVSFLEMFLCDPDSDGGVVQSVILYVVDLGTLYAVNACVLNHGNFFGVMMLEFLRSIRLSAGLILFLLMLVVFVLMFFLVVRDLLTTDILVAMLSVNIVAAVMRFGITDSNRIWVLVLALSCGLVSKLVRRFFSEVDYFVFDALFALNAFVATGLISALIFAIAR